MHGLPSPVTAAVLVRKKHGPLQVHRVENLGSAGEQLVKVSHK